MTDENFSQMVMKSCLKYVCRISQPDNASALALNCCVARMDDLLCHSPTAHRLYKDLLMLENYAVMTYCGFSKILKKHDKNSRCALTRPVVVFVAVHVCAL